MLSNRFKELVFLSYHQNNVLIYPLTFKIESLMIKNFELKSYLNAANQTTLDDETKAIINIAKLPNEKIRNYSIEMPWPPDEKDLGPNLLDTFCNIVISGQSMDSDNSRSD